MPSGTNIGLDRKGFQIRKLFLLLGLGFFLGMAFFIRVNSAAEIFELEGIPEKSGRIFLRLPVQEGETFQIHYTHSVELLPVQETFLIKEGRLALSEAKWLSFGAGLGYTGEGKMVLEDEWVKIIEMERFTEPLLLRVGTIADHRLIYRGEEFALRDFVEGMDLVSFSINKKKKYSLNLGKMAPK